MQHSSGICEVFIPHKIPSLMALNKWKYAWRCIYRRQHTRLIQKATSINKASFSPYPWQESLADKKASGKCTHPMKVILFVCCEERISVAGAFLQWILPAFLPLDLQTVGLCFALHPQRLRADQEPRNNSCTGTKAQYQKTWCQHTVHMG